MQPKTGGRLLLKLNTCTGPIANKYREGKMKRTLKRKLKVRETVGREAHGISKCLAEIQVVSSGVGLCGRSFGTAACLLTKVRDCTSLSFGCVNERSDRVTAIAGR